MLSLPILKYIECHKPTSITKRAKGILIGIIPKTALYLLKNVVFGAVMMPLILRIARAAPQNSIATDAKTT